MSSFQRLREFGLAVLLGLAVIFGLVLFPKWKDAVHSSLMQQSAEPFRIAGNFYYVGGSDTTSFLLTGPEGDVLIDGGYPETESMIIGSIQRLGFDIKDVKVLVNTEPHLDHAGGLAKLQNVSGARLWVSEATAGVIAAGGAGSRPWPYKLGTYIPLTQYPAPRIDHRLKDGDTIRQGPIELTAHVMPGCTAWSFPVRHENRQLHVVHLCDFTPPPSIGALDRAVYSNAQADFERSFRTLHNLPVDIWVTTHARAWGRYRKFEESRSADDPVAPFIDPEGYRKAVADAEAAFRKLLAD